MKTKGQKAKGTRKRQRRSRCVQRVVSRIRVYRQKGPGYWACIYFEGGGIEAVQSPQPYGFPTKEEARAEALRRCAANGEMRRGGE